MFCFEVGIKTTRPILPGVLVIMSISPVNVVPILPITQPDAYAIWILL